MISEGVSADELARAKGHVRGSLALSVEDANSRMVRLGRQELTGGDHYSVGERIAKIEAVTRQDVLEVAQAVLDGPRVIGAVGPLDESQLEGFVL